MRSYTASLYDTASLYALTPAIIVFLAIRDIHPIGAAFTWNGGAIGTFSWPAGDAGQGSLMAMWIAFLTYLLACPLIAAFHLLVQIADDLRVIRTARS
jgi:hypothetical protein